MKGIVILEITRSTLAVSVFRGNIEFSLPSGHTTRIDRKMQMILLITVS